MQKLFRSLIAVGGLAGLVACGDDVSVVAPSDPLTISGAPVTAVQVGATIQLSASEAATWVSSAPGVATVDGTGLVTAVAGGVASITATATADANKKASVTITVTALVNAAISVQNITVTGTPGNTVNVNNVAGSIDVNLNVVPGDQVVQSVEVLIDGNVACTQNLSGAQAAVTAEADAVIVSCQINTAAFNATTGVANFANGSHVLSARAIITGGTQTATPSTNLVFNNQSGVIATITNSNGTDPAAAINPGTGLQWIGGGVTLNFIGVSYVAGTTVASVSCTIFGKSPVVTLTNGVATVNWTESSSAWSPTNTSVTNYLSPAAESISCPSATLSNGQPLVPAAGTTPLLNFGAPGMTNAAMPALQVLRLDNFAPGAAAASANGVAQIDVATLVVPMTLPWVNATTTLTPSATGSGTNTLGLPSLATLNTAAAGPANDVDEGVDGIAVTVNVPAAGGALPTTGGSCNITGLTAVTTGSQLTETTVSSAFPARIVFKDALGNQRCLDLVQAFGADFTAPTASITAGPVANTGYSAALPNWAVTASDNASGFSATPLRVIMTRLNASGSTSCVLGSGSSCTTPSQQPLTFSGTGGSATEGYYTTTFSVVDAAGNSASLISAQLNELDTTVPTFVGGISLPSVIAGAATNTFTTSVADNLDLGSIFGLVAYPVGVNLQYPTQQIGTFGPALEQAASVGYAVSNWIRCLNAAGSFAVASGQPTAIQLSLTDQTTVPAANTATLASAAFGANAQACTGPGIEGAVGNITGINFFNHNAPVYGTGLNAVDLDGQNVANTSSTTVALQAVADVALNTSADPFSRVDFYFVNTAGNLEKIGTGTASLAQTQTNRTYTYNFTWNPDAPVQVGNVSVVAIGVDAQGDAVFATNAQVVVIVQ